MGMASTSRVKLYYLSLVVGPDANIGVLTLQHTPDYRLARTKNRFVLTSHHAS
jgi:hypothetical protein